jgi:hypothetical protein
VNRADHIWDFCETFCITLGLLAVAAGLAAIGHAYFNY